jgi:DNA-binding transcriptional MerR regulator
MKAEEVVMLQTKQVRNDLLPARTYSSTEVAKLAQVTLRQLQWWDERKVVIPRHEGHKRLYEPEEVIEITVIAELRRKGFSLQSIRHILRVLQCEMRRHLQDLLSPDSELYLLTDGKSIHLEDRRERIIDLLKSARKPIFLVSISDQVRRLEGISRRTPIGETSPDMRIRAAV